MSNEKTLQKDPRPSPFANFLSFFPTVILRMVVVFFGPATGRFTFIKSVETAQII
jgi:hypothetical protein